MKASANTRHSRILGLGEQRPVRLMTNNELPSTLDTNDEWIRQRTGIVSRGIAGDDESVVSMASEAARKAIADSGVDPAAVGLVVLATCSLPQPIPGGAAQVATAIGTGQCGAFDVNAACAGFCYALSVASDAVRVGSVDYAVVIGAEKISHWLDWSDRSSAILFGDGAGAVVVGPSDEPGIGPVVFGSDGSGAGLIDMTPDNQRIVNSLARQIGAANAVIADDVVDTGNTSAASVPLALARLRREGKVTTGDLALTLAFGSGLTWAGSVVTVP
jgi:3-oxoacyl-[acyl-carrier-protein] synthase-3